ncbi:Atpase Family Aaa Domain-Containing Protein 3B [Manis pentadactyla]|nr:Atpase Family Aaa Domain-Containing Protein 3B [Manis pentadactyla]
MASPTPMGVLGGIMGSVVPGARAHPSRPCASGDSTRRACAGAGLGPGRSVPNGSRCSSNCKSAVCAVVGLGVFQLRLGWKQEILKR